MAITAGSVKMKSFQTTRGHPTSLRSMAVSNLSAASAWQPCHKPTFGDGKHTTHRNGDDLKIEKNKVFLSISMKMT